MSHYKSQQKILHIAEGVRAVAQYDMVVKFNVLDFFKAKHENDSKVITKVSNLLYKHKYYNV